jgi:tryptophanase
VPPRFETIIERFRIHSVEPPRLTSEDERRDKIRVAAYNLFNARPHRVLADSAPSLPGYGIVRRPR